MRIKQLLLLLATISGHYCMAQHVEPNKKACVIEYDSTLKEKVYTYADQMPIFKRGDTSLVNYFTKNFHYPEEQVIHQGSIWMVFIVDENGKVRKETIFNKKKEEFTNVDKEALRMLAGMPDWKPGSCNGIKVPVRILWPVRF